MNRRLDFLLRKNKGRSRLESFEKVFLKSGFLKPELEYIELKKTDEIIEQLDYKFRNVTRQSELISDKNIFVTSNIVKNTYLRLNKNSNCYIYTDDYQYCGMFICNARRCFDLAFEVAKNDFQNTCFLLDVNFNYYLLVNYNDENDNSHPNSFDIQLIKSSK